MSDAGSRCATIRVLLLSAFALASGCGTAGRMAVTASADPTADAALDGLAPCRLEGVERGARCGVFKLPENPSRPEGRHIAVHVAVLPAVAQPASADPIVPLMGGPGEDAISAAAYFADRFDGLLHDRDLVLVDQRGTGRSGALRCRLYSDNRPADSLRDLFPLAAVRQCASELARQADLSQYSFDRFAGDLEFIRRALGYGQLNLFAGSYGTRAAQVYLRTFPSSVRTVYMGSVVPIDVAIPLPLAKAAEDALGKLFQACAAQADCHAAFPELESEFEQIVSRLDAGTVHVPVRHGAGQAVLVRGRVLEWFRSRLYRAESATELPWAIHQAFLGNWQPVVEGILDSARGADSALSFGLFFAIACNEDVAFIQEGQVGPATAGTALGPYRVRQQQAACALWPKASIPDRYRLPVRSSVPALFVSGDSDPATPLWFTDHAAPGFADRVEIVLQGQGHTEWNDCVGRIYRQFVRAGETSGLGAVSCDPTPRPRFRTR